MHHVCDSHLQAAMFQIFCRVSKYYFANSKNKWEHSAAVSYFKYLRIITAKTALFTVIYRVLYVLYKNNA